MKVNKIRNQTNKTAINVIQLIILVGGIVLISTIVAPIFAIFFIFYIGSKKQYEYKCSECDDTTTENSAKCYKCGNEFK